MIFRNFLFYFLLVFTLFLSTFTYSLASERVYIQNSSYSVIAYIEADGTVYSNSNKIMGYINRDGSILSSSYSGIGYIETDGRILNSSYKKIDYLHTDGSLLDSSYEPIAYIKSGYVLSPSNSTVLYFDKSVIKKWIAAFLMFFY